MRWARTKWSQHGWAKWIGYLVMVFHQFSTLFGWVIGPTRSMMRYQELSQIRMTWHFGYFQLPTQLNNMVVNSLCVFFPKWRFHRLRTWYSSTPPTINSPGLAHCFGSTCSNTRQKKGWQFSSWKGQRTCHLMKPMLSHRKKTSTVLIPQAQWLRSSPHPILKPWPPRIEGQGPDSVIPRRPQTSGPNSSWADAGRQVQRNERPKGYEVKVCQDLPENLTIQLEMLHWFIAFQDFLANFLTICRFEWMSLSISNECPKPPRLTEFRGFHLHQALLPMTFLPL